MKKTILVCFAFLAISVTGVKAQGILDKIDKSLNKVDKASNTADRAGKTGSRVGSLFGKKKAEAESTTTISLSGVTFASLKTINDNVQGSKGVASTKMKFNSSTSTIVVSHEGSSENLFKALQKTAPSIFSDKTLQGLDDGQISIKIK